MFATFSLMQGALTHNDYLSIPLPGVACAHQTRGAVRDSTKLSQAAFWYKVYIATAAAEAEQSFEVSLLNSALNLLQTSLLDALPAVWAATGESSTYDAFDAAQMRNATCLCSTSVRTPLLGTPYYTDEAAYLAANCTGGLCTCTAVIQ